MSSRQKYSYGEIFQIIKDFHFFQQNFDPNVDKGILLSEDTTVEEWRMICDLEKADNLVRIYANLFDIDTENVDELLIILRSSNSTLRQLCNWLAEKGKRKYEFLSSSNDYFAVLGKELKKNGSDITEIDFKTSLTSLMKKDAAVIAQTLSLIQPGSIRSYTFQSPRYSKLYTTISVLLILLSICLVLTYTKDVLFGLFGVIGLFLLLIKENLLPKSYQINGHETIGGVINEMIQNQTSNGG
ncbi:MAG: hypothetical protein ACK40G_18200 [Cytophagaceae bacterium]